MASRSDRIGGSIYLGYLLHYVGHWPVTASDLQHMAADHGFEGFANYFAGMPCGTTFGSADEVKRMYLLTRAVPAKRASA